MASPRFAASESRKSRSSSMNSSTSRIVLARHVSSTCRQSCAGVPEPLPNVGALQPVRLLRIESDVTVVDLRQRDAVGVQARRQRARDIDYRRRVRERPRQLLDKPDELAEAELMLDEQHVGRHRRGHRRVAVAIAADPRPEAKGGSREPEDDAVARRARRRDPPIASARRCRRAERGSRGRSALRPRAAGGRLAARSSATRAGSSRGAG